jgi:4-hydroxyphenylpyruvate dioxygenase
MSGVAAHNPMGTDGFEFVEFAAPDPEALGGLFAQLGFACRARHRSKRAWLWTQGDIHFVVNAEPGSFGERFARLHGPSICAMAFRVADAASAWRRALELGAWGIESRAGPMELNIPAIKGVGDSLIYLVDRYGARGTIYDVDFVPLEAAPAGPAPAGLTHIDHLTHNLHRGRMAEWVDFYSRLFGFSEIRRFDIRGQYTGLHSRALASPCGKIRIPLNEASDEQSQVQEYLDAYRGEGIQHVALATGDICASVERLRARGVRFLSTPDSYYEALPERLPKHGEDLERLRRLGILLDGDPERGLGLLLQIFTEPLVGPIFLELIQRKGNQGFGEGNFQALFEAMEVDQIRRGVLRP